jgi:outer membrane biosynthesis protein TonB
MLKCLFVDLTSIKSAIPKSKFDPAQIERLADSILASDGLISPLILSASGVDRYTIIAGDLAYYAALRAKEKDLRKAEMVNAFVIPAAHQPAAISQLALLSPDGSSIVDREPSDIPVPTAVTPTTAVIDELFDRLSAHLDATLDRQLTPISQQLTTVATTVDRHERILSSTEAIVPVTLPPEPAPTTPATGKKTPRSTKTPKQDKSPAVRQPKVSEVTPQSVPVAPAKKSTPAKSQQSATTPASKSAKSDPFAGIDPEQLARTLQLVNTSPPHDLALMMSRSGITKGEKLAIDLIAKRDTQPHQIFESWAEIVASKISKLTAKIAVDIVNKLK